MILKENFLCLKCGNCCKMPGFIHISKTEAKKIAAFLNISYIEFKKKYTDWILFCGRVLKGSREASCIFLKENKCLIYPVRPEQCKTFPFWDNILKDNTEIQYVKKFCKGIKD